VKVEKMKFEIVGAGAMGCLLGSFLAKANEEVWLVDVWEEHAIFSVDENEANSVKIQRTWKT